MRHAVGCPPTRGSRCRAARLRSTLMNSQLPTGTVTFLFTDIEGSTRLWETYPEAMQRAVARHFELLGREIHAAGGRIFKTQGDAVCAAFSTAPEALEAALASQRALIAEDWGEIGALRVRMALHTGAPEEHRGDYGGAPVNRVARLVAAGHGSQILLSLACQELVRDSLPEWTSLQDLGEHRLRDLIRPERIFQGVHPDLPAQFPPLRTLEARPNNLPLQRTPLLGREEELAAVHALFALSGIGMVTLTGPGGTGKTRLGLQLGADLLDLFEHGVFFVPLAPIPDPQLVAPTISRTLGLREEGLTPLEGLKEHLKGQEALLILDNFEQIVEAAPVVAELLSACPRLKVLVTSRAVLRIQGEREYPVPPLALPDLKRLPPTEVLSQYAAVQLFIQRAAAVQPDFVVTNENAPAVAEICARLDGLPLAIELAAARVKLLPPEAMLARLDNRLKLLTRGARDLPDRQQTLRNAIAWGYDLLPDEEKQLYRRLSVFSGGFSLESAEAVCSPDDELDLLDGIASLVDKSFLRQEQSEGESRFLMLETIREFGLEALETTGELAAYRRRHAEHFADLAERAAPELRGPGQHEWLDRLEREQANLRRAFRWAEEHRDELAWSLAGSLWRFWFLRGYMREGWQMLERLFALDPPGSVAVRARAFAGAAFVAFFHGDPDECSRIVRQSLQLCEEAGDDWNLAFTLCGVGMTGQHRGEWDQARVAVERALNLARRVGDPWLISMSTTAYWPTVIEFGDYSQAEPMYEECLEISRRAQDLSLLAWPLLSMGIIYLRTGRPDLAEQAFAEGISASHAVMNKPGVAISLDALVATWAEVGRLEDAARLLGAVEALRETTACPRQRYELPVHEEALRLLHAGLGAERTAALLQEGRSLSLEHAVELALGDGEGARGTPSRS